MSAPSLSVMTKASVLLQIRVKCNEDDTIGDLKKLVAAQTGPQELQNPALVMRCNVGGTLLEPAAVGCLTSCCRH